MWNVLLIVFLCFSKFADFVAPASQLGLHAPQARGKAMKQPKKDLQNLPTK